MADHLAVAQLNRPGGPQQKARRSIDFIVNGQSLFVATEANLSDMCGRFSADLPGEIATAADVFLLRKPADLPSGRCSLFVCPECGDIGCGAITVRITRAGDTFVWSDFAYENDYENPRPVDIGPYNFGEDEYTRAITEAMHV